MVEVRGRVRVRGSGIGAWSRAALGGFGSEPVVKG